jgi:predicted nucleotidyltransferase
MSTPGEQIMPTTGRALLGSWFLEGLGWFALGEAYMRVLIEGVLLLIFLLLGWNIFLIAGAFLTAHTILWFLCYGGYAKLSSVRGRRRPLPRLLEFRERVIERVKASSHFRAALLYGSSGRGTMNEQSDVDLVLVPSRPFPRGILALWALRAGSALQRLPLEASSADLERHLRTRLHGPGSVLLKAAPPTPGSVRRGALVSFSGIDGSGKTTVAKR